MCQISAKDRHKLLKTGRRRRRHDEYRGARARGWTEVSDCDRGTDYGLRMGQTPKQIRYWAVADVEWISNAMMSFEHNCQFSWVSIT